MDVFTSLAAFLCEPTPASPSTDGPESEGELESSIIPSMLPEDENRGGNGMGAYCIVA